VAKRGEVLLARRRVGFAAANELERFVVLQHERLNGILPTLVVAPLDAALPIYGGNPLAVPIPAGESGTPEPQVLVLSAICSLPQDRFQPLAAGRLRPASLAMTDTALRLLLDLQ